MGLGAARLAKNPTCAHVERAPPSRGASLSGDAPRGSPNRAQSASQAVSIVGGGEEITSPTAPTESEPFLEAERAKRPGEESEFEGDP
eukprot:2992346-Pyramimonas_sp.AAC.1